MSTAKFCRYSSAVIFVASFVIAPVARPDDLDALALQGAQTATPATISASSVRWYAEGTLGHLTQRYGLPARASNRLSLDLNVSARLTDAWRLTLSDRLDQVHPTEVDSPNLVNSLREAYASWRDASGSRVIEFGRINLRNGPAYGNNPTDYFRDGALRSVVSVDPLALRENRLGTVMLRYQAFSPTSSWSFALAPKLVNSASDASFSADFGATNNQHRALATWSLKANDRLSGQLLGYWAQRDGMQLGANATALVSEALVVHAELSRGKGHAGLKAPAAASLMGNRVSAGLTYSSPTHLSLTVERAYNGFGATAFAWNMAAIDRRAAYLQQALSQQNIASRNAWMVYATQKQLVLRNLDLTAMLRINADDQSRFAWAELRYHWPSFDAALQWSGSTGSAGTEYAIHPQRSSVQLLAAWYF